MHRLTLSAVACVSLLSWGAAIAPLPGAQPKRLLFRKYGFSMESPAGWNAARTVDGLPLFTNFPFSELQAQFLLPKGGATINFIALEGVTRRRGDESLPGWARLDAVGSAQGTVLPGVLEAAPSTGISEAITASFDEATYSPNDQRQHEFSVYWSFRNQRFAAHLFYVVGNPKGAEYENVLRQAVRSVRPVSQ
jgi:hypothetical protein